jgi:hypothetical protein
MKGTEKHVVEHEREAEKWKRKIDAIEARLNRQ